MTTPVRSGWSVPSPDLGRRPDLHSRIANALNWSLSAPRNKIDILVQGDWVTLRGVVERSYEKSCAEAMAQRAPGVAGVRNEIEVRPANHY